jgi:hypothetical protein
MEFLKKHIEKFALAVVLIAFIASVAYFALRIGTLTETIRNAPSARKPKGTTVAPLNTDLYTNAIAELTTPFEWLDMPTNPFLGWTTNSDTNGVKPPPPPEPIFTLENVEYLPFRLLFRAYSWDVEKQRAYNFQINFVNQARTFFVAEVGQPIADRYRDTGFRITSFARVLTNITDNIGPREVDWSVLTIQRTGEDPVELILNKLTTQSKPIAVIRIRGEAQPRRVIRQQIIEFDGRKYKVIDITSEQMLILDTQSKEDRPVVVPRRTSTFKPVIGP